MPVIGQSNIFINEYLPEAEIHYTGSSAQAAEIIKAKGESNDRLKRISELYDLES